LISAKITEYGVDVFREDFNIDPLHYWQDNDTPDRLGMTELKYMEGFYAFWDELLRRHPGLIIDNCASGGRRIDLETMSRSVPLWRSDTGCSPGHPEWNQMQSMALAQYVPLYAISTWSPTAYETRSAATSGVSLEWPYLDAGFPAALAKQTIAEVRACAPYWYGDLYPLTPASTALDQFTAWQLQY
jgi:alpha-galactosidase